MMDNKSKKVATFGIFKSRPQLDEAVNSLKIAGFSNSDISVLMADKQSMQEFAAEKNTKAPEGTAAGVSAGAVVGGGLGWLVGIGALAIPGIGPFVAAGPIMVALAGAGVGGALGGVTGALVGFGLPEYEAKRYEGMVKDGGSLLSIHCDTKGEIERAKEVLERAGAEDIASTGEASMNVRKPAERRDTSTIRT